MQTRQLTQLIMQNSIFSSLLLMGVVLLVLQLPLSKLDGLIAERQQSQLQVTQDIASSWGGEQTIAGPYLVVPYDDATQAASRLGVALTEPARRYAVYLPTRLLVHAATQPQVRYRGLYEVPLYQADVRVDAEFSRPDPADLKVTDDAMRWDEASIVMSIGDLKALTGRIDARWQQRSLEVMPGTDSAVPGFHFPLRMPFAENKKAQMALQFSLNGSQRLLVAPLGRNSVIQLQGSWPSPGFQGEWLPSRRTVAADGFDAEWDVPFIARGLPVMWHEQQPDLKHDSLHWVGVRLQPAVDAYRQTERATKYQLLFLLMIFGFFWLFQLVASIRLHPLHYLLTGGSVCLFYLLLLSLAEHLGFVLAYLCACSAVIVQITLYGKSVLQSWKRASGLGLLLAAMFGYLWSLLQEQDFALIFGSAGLFFTLSLVMFFTRNRLGQD